MWRGRGGIDKVSVFEVLKLQCHLGFVCVKEEPGIIFNMYCIFPFVMCCNNLVRDRVCRCPPILEYSDRSRRSAIP